MISREKALEYKRCTNGRTQERKLWEIKENKVETGIQKVMGKKK